MDNLAKKGFPKLAGMDEKKFATLFEPPREQLGNEIARYHKFQSGVLGIKEKNDPKAKDLDIRNYAQYILKEGAIFEKRELLSRMRSKLVLKNKQLSLKE